MMSMFQRHQTVSVRKTSQGYVARGELSDHLYGMALKIAVDENLVVTRIEGEMIRYTTSSCPRGLRSLPKAEGLDLSEKGVQSIIRKEVGRPGCRHLATLLVTLSRCINRARDFQQGSENVS